MGSVRKGTSNHRGILMSSQMIRAYQKGWKCMTRRTGEGEPVGILKASYIIEDDL